MRTKPKRILALLLLAAMAVTWIPVMAAASDEEVSASVAETDVEASVQEEQTPEEAQAKEELTEPEEPEPLDVDLSSGRLLVDSGDATIVPEDAPVLGEHDGIYLLQYDTVEQAEDAYREFSELAKSVEADIPFSLADEEETPVVEENTMTEAENPITILEQQIEEAEPVAEPKVIALIDSGTVLSDNVIARYSVIDDDPADCMGHGTKEAVQKNHSRLLDRATFLPVHPAQQTCTPALLLMLQSPWALAKDQKLAVLPAKQ